MKFMLGTKGRMTQVFDDKGVVSAATVVTAGPLTVTQIMGKEKQGYEAAQVGFGTKKESRVNKAQSTKPFRVLREFPTDAEAKLEAGQTIDVSIFVPGDVVAVSAISKGKGFQGVVKRHGFSGGPRSHGQKNKERAPGSIGGGGRAGGRVVKGMRMAGRTLRFSSASRSKISKSYKSMSRRVPSLFQALSRDTPAHSSRSADNIYENRHL